MYIVDFFNGLPPSIFIRILFTLDALRMNKIRLKYMSLCHFHGLERIMTLILSFYSPSKI